MSHFKKLVKISKTGYVIRTLKSCVIELFNLFFRNSISRSIQQALQRQ